MIGGSVESLVAAVALAVAVVLVLRPAPATGSLGTPGAAPAVARRGAPRHALAGAAAALAGGGLLVDTPALRVPVGLGALLGAGGAVLWGMRRRRTRARERSALVLETAGVLASELASGRPPAAALTQAATEWDHLAHAAQAASLGADVPSALRTLAALPGAGDLVLVAAAWQVAHHTGQSLAPALSVVRDDLRAAAEARRIVAAELASARATARLVALLPVAALAMGRGSGGDPIGFLLHEPLGWACAGLGCLLLVAGLVWIEAIAAGVDAESVP